MADAADRSLSDLAARFSEMGVSIEPLPGGRCLHGRLRLSTEPFPSLLGPRRYDSITFSTVGATQIKCLAPLPFFHLPLITLGGCASAAELEERIRESWASRERNVRAAAARLEGIGAAPEPEADGRVIAFSIGVDDAAAAGRMLDAQRVILPGRGPLSGLRAPSPEQRMTRFQTSWQHASDAEIALTQHLDELRTRFAREQAPVLIVAPSAAAPLRLVQPKIVRPVHGGRRVLLVGPRLGRDAALITHLKQLGYRVRVEFSAHEALQAFQEHSFDLVFADTHLGRSEGIELIPDLQALPGIERVPVVLVDEHSRDQLRDAARAVGAAGYLVHPLDGARIASGVERILDARRRRRFSRLPWRLSVRLNDGRSAFTTSIGRMGAFVGTEWSEALENLRSCEISLPELGRVLRVETEGVYQVQPIGAGEAGLGLQFRAFSERDEAAWIEYLTDLFGSPLARGDTE